MNKKSAFTLTDLLMASTIIAVISLIMMNTVFNSQPNREQLMIKKVYTETSNIVAQMINHEDLYNTEGNNMGFANTSQISYQNKSFGSGTSTDQDAKNKFCKLFKTFLNISTTTADCGSNVTFTNGTESQGMFTTSDGVVWILPNSNFSEENADIWVDVSLKGSGNSNCTAENNLNNCPNGPDRFRIIVNRDGTINVPNDDKVLRYYLNHTEFNKSYKTIKNETKDFTINK